MKHLFLSRQASWLKFTACGCIALLLAGFIVPRQSFQSNSKEQINVEESSHSHIVLVSSKPAKDIQRDEQKLNIPMRIVLTLAAFALFPFLLLALTALVTSMANPLFWLWLILVGAWAVGFGLAFNGIWTIQSKRRRRIGILLGALSIIFSTFSIFQLLEIFLIIPFVPLGGQILIGILVVSVILEMILLGRKFLKEERAMENKNKTNTPR